jgi:hypothetical protein
MHGCNSDPCPRAGFNFKGQAYLSIFLLFQLGCAAAIPLPSGQGLAYDLDRVVEAQEQTGWSIDELETNEALKDTLQSLCRANAQEQQQTRILLDKDLLKAGGPSRLQWRSGQRDMRRLRPALRAERNLGLLDFGLLAQKRGACPLGWEAQSPYQTIQDPMARWMFGIQTGGRAYAQVENGVLGAGGGGAGRLIMGPTFNRRWGLLAVLEFGGAGRFESFDLGQPIDVPDLLVMPAALLQLRRQFGSYYLFMESGALGFLSKEDPDLRGGLRSAAGVGITRIKVGPVLPTLGAFIGYDRIAAGTSSAVIDQVYTGVNAGFLWGL